MNHVNQLTQLDLGNHVQALKVVIRIFGWIKTKTIIDKHIK
jgi:hypothetical protein